MAYNIINAVSKNRVPQWGNQKKYIGIHYLGVVGQNHELAADGSGAHYYIYWDGTIYQRCSHDAIVWAVGTAGIYTQKHPVARNANTISIEMCCKCDGDSSSAEDKKWYFTEETQEACVWLVQKLMKELGIPAENVLRHYDIVNKICPAPYVHNNKYKTAWTWEEFKARIAGTAAVEAPWYRVRKSWDDAASQKNAYHDLGLAKKCADENPGYSVYDENGKCLYTSVSKGLQAADFKGLTEAQAAAKILDLAYADYQISGILPSVTAAQAILESGYLTTDLAQNANNIFGMKCELSNNTWAGSTWDGSSKYTKQTQEQDKNGNAYTVTADFRKYPCIEDSIADHSAYLLGAMNGSVLRYAGLTKAADYVEAITIIKNGGYATDVQYISKICSIIERFGLDKCDGTCSSSDSTADILPETTQPWYRIRKTWADASGQVGAYHDLEKAKACADNNPGYSVYDDAGNVVYTAAVQYKVQAGSFKSKANADKLVAQLKAARFDAFTYLGDDGQYKVQAGAFADKANADVLVDRFKAAGFAACIK